MSEEQAMEPERVRLQRPNGYAVDVELHGRDLFGDPYHRPKLGALAERFQYPPVTVLDARGGEWLARKQAWLKLGIQSELGRSEDMIFQSNSPMFDHYGRSAAQQQGTSIFDPVLCELAYRWFCPEGGQVLDPFAGGSVRGIVAAMLGYRYWGCDLSAEQIEANRAQAAALLPPERPAPTWLCGDSLDQLSSAPPADLVFSCPPYGDLEQYSADPRDLSNMSWPGFLRAYRLIIARAARRLRNYRFACFVVGDIRGPDGAYRGFVPATIAAFEACGLRYYNEAVLVTSMGTAPLRAARQFNGGRKFVKSHQNVLMFVKGDAKRAARACVLNEAGVEDLDWASEARPEEDEPEVAAADAEQAQYAAALDQMEMFR